MNFFTASEENLDTRYSKLKTDHDSVTKQLEEANKLIEESKKRTDSDEVLQGKIAEYEASVANLQEELEQQFENDVKMYGTQVYPPEWLRRCY